MKLSCQRFEGLRIDYDANLDSARDAVIKAIEWLNDQGLTDEECQAWELVLAEASTNCVLHATNADPLRIELVGTENKIEISLTDHSVGFEWPDHAELPEDDDNENGRGLFIIQNLTDHSSYLHGARENVLNLSRTRTNPKPLAEDLRETLDLMTSEVAACYETLANIFRISAEAAKDLPPDELAAKWLEELYPLSGADFLILRMITPDATQLALLATAHANSNLSEFIELSDTTMVESRAANGRQDCWFDANTTFSSSDPLTYLGESVSGFAHPLETGGEVIGVLTMGVRSAHWEPKARDIHVVRSLADFLGTLLYSLRSRDESIHSRLIQRELQIAADIQRSLLPAELPQSSTLQSAGHLTTVGEVGGDFVDGIALADGSRLFVIADVMGKGVPAALFATAFRSLLHSHLNLATQPRDLMRKLNAALFPELDRAEMFITVQLAYITADALTLRTSSAGHSPLLVANSKTVIELHANGPPLGVIKDIPYEQQDLSLSDFTHLMLHTDGLSDPSLPKEYGFSKERLHSWLRVTSVEGIDAWDARDTLLHMHHLNQDATHTRDDATFVILTREGALRHKPLPHTLTHAHR